MGSSPLGRLFDKLKTSERGLTSEEARARLSLHGPNAINGRRQSALAQFLQQFGNPLVLILLVTSVIAAALGDAIDATIITLIVMIGAVITFIQTYRSENAVERLRTQIAPTATVLRDGAWGERPRAELVPGDIVRLCAGDMVPADARLIESRDLHVQQSALTGESLPVEKEASQDAGDTSPANPSLVFLGTSVVSGTATAVVVATGPRTSFGDIVARLNARPPETEFDRGMRRFSFLILQTVFFLVIFVIAVNVALRRDSLEALLFAVALAVGLTPEFLPMITAVTLAQGAVHMARKKVIVKHLTALQNLGSMDVLCSDKTGTLTAGSMTFHQSLDPVGHPDEHPLRLAVVNSVHETGIKSPLDHALLAQPMQAAADYRKVDEMPFDFERRRLSVVVDRGDSGERLLITKGAPESLLPLCSAYEAAGAVRVFDEHARRQTEAKYRQLSEDGFRVLAVASRKVADQPAYSVRDEHDLVLAGFVTFRDPPLDDAAAAIADLRDDGVQVKILTGDNELVARHVCHEVGLDASRIVLGTEIDRMSDGALWHVAEEANVFARVSPAQKNRILTALKKRGHVVGFLGDGINDAPSLHAADVGISAAGAVDVAQAAAEVILQERSLRVLHSGIIEGRKAFGNVMKYLLMGTSSNFGNMISMAAASLILPFLPMLPMQILLNSLLYDLAQITIPTDNVDETFIRKPRRWDISLVRRFMLYTGPISSLFDFVTFYVLLRLFAIADPDRERLFHTGWFVESLATQTLVLLIIRTAGNPFDSRPSRALLASVFGIVAVGILLPFLPGAGVLGFAPLPLVYFGFLVVATASYLGLVQWVKRLVLGRFLE